ncbi:hypothetical protein FNV43_RR25895 [Rhamnella rubrinervis]|uniref:Uncharacterized protein n=1 Tax=Rhamnella rubrinervis TaxID=2594499 RepID=A0A8K0DHU7_9ROSA|nr:hypothetical protein FNV43_RR25895 [Rhamnella rubrinervis]
MAGAGDEDADAVLSDVEGDDPVPILLRELRKKTMKTLLIIYIFLVGVDTGAITMIWAMAELAKKPNRMKKAQDERYVIGNKGKVDESDICSTASSQGNYITLKFNGYEIYPKTRIQIHAWQLGQSNGTLITGITRKNSSQNGSSIVLLISKGDILSCCPLDPVEGFVLVYIWQQQLWILDLQISYTGLIGNCLKERKLKKIEDISMEEEPGISLAVSKKAALNLVPVRFSTAS